MKKIITIEENVSTKHVRVSGYMNKKERGMWLHKEIMKKEQKVIVRNENEEMNCDLQGS